MLRKKRIVKKVAASTGDRFIINELKSFCVPIDTVRLKERNPRINDEAAVKLAALIRQHGFRIPIVVNEQTGEIESGNTRYKAMRLLKARTIPVLTQGFANQTRADLFAVSDNKANEYSDWDVDALEKLIRASQQEETQIEVMTGFSELEVRDLLNDDTDSDFFTEKGASGRVSLKGRVLLIVTEATQLEGLRTWVLENISACGIPGVEVR